MDLPPIDNNYNLIDEIVFENVNNELKFVIELYFNFSRALYFAFDLQSLVFMNWKPNCMGCNEIE